MGLPDPRALLVVLKEMLEKRSFRREPETSLVMSDEHEVHAFQEGGRVGGPLSALYVFNMAHIAQAIRGCKRVVDLGCGPANQLCLVAKLFPETNFIGIDLSEAMLKVAAQNIKEQGLTNVQLLKGDLAEISEIEDQSVDGVISTFTLHHLPRLEDLERCFKNIKRVLKPHGAVFLVDFGRLKRLDSVFYFAYRDADNLPYLCTLDCEKSLRAAFSPGEYIEIVKKAFPTGVQIFNTFKAPLMIIVKTENRLLTKELQEALQLARLEVIPKYRRDIDDVRTFFHLGGLRGDPFGKIEKDSEFSARLRMFDFFELPAIRTVLSHPIRRIFWLGLLTLEALAVVVFKNNKIQKFFGRRLRARLGKLKGPIMKVGQMASYLSHQISEPVRNALEPLQSISSPLDGKVIKQIVEKELGGKISELFSEWRNIPIASASISQIHFARLPDGRPVVVKVRYPRIMKIVKSDILALRLISPLLGMLTGIGNMRELVDELECLILDECDFKKAARFQERFRKHFESDNDIVVPEVYSSHTTESVFTMEYVDGQSYHEFKASSSQEEKNKAGEIMWRFAAASINKFSLYNGDPHPGNYLFLKNGKICFLDFGFTKEFSEAFMRLWKEQTLAGCKGDFEKFKGANLKLGYEVPGVEYDHKAMFDLYRSTVYQAWRLDREFQFTDEFVTSELDALLKLFKRQSGSHVPSEFLTILRLLWGQHAILADLKATANWHRIVYPMIDEASA